MSKLEKFTNCYSLSKTLRFKAIPVGKTQENIDNKRLLVEDEKRAEDYKGVKKLLDRYYLSFINDVLHSIKLKNLNNYISLFRKKTRTEKENKELENLEINLRKEIAKAFKGNEGYKSLFKKDIIETILPEFLDDKDEIALVNSFNGFTTAFTGFFDNRENMFSEEAKSTSIAFRCINENLTRYISNMDIFEKVDAIFDKHEVQEIKEKILNSDYDVEDFFEGEFFNFVLTQEGIDVYNAIIGGFVTESGEKIKGLNEYINLYNQKTKQKLPKFKPLYKQVLSDRESLSFYGEGYTSDEEVLEVFRNTLNKNSEIFSSIKKLEKLFKNFDEYSSAGIFVKNGPAISTISKDIFGEWNVIRDKWNAEYDDIHLKKKAVVTEKYEDDRRKSFKKIGSFSLEQLQEYADADLSVVEKLKEIIIQKVDEIYKVYGSSEKLFDADFVLEKSLKKNDAVVAIMKDLLDSVKSFENYIKAFFGEGKETNRDESFYGDFVLAYDILLKVDHIYDAIRNYVTQKPYSKDKFKLYFQNPQFMGGWDKDKETDYRATILRYGSKYYLAIMDKKYAKCLQKIDKDDVNGNYEKINYKLLPGPNKMLPKVFFSKKWMAYYNPSEDIQKIYKNGTFKKGDMFNLNDCHKLIDFFKDSISRYPKWSNAYDFNFSETEKYKDIAGFYREVEEQGYKVSFESASKKEVDKLVEEGKLYMFQIYNKDFSDKSHGTPNLHTMYFKLLFDENNHGQIRLSGGAELFMRRASLKKEELVVHPANSPIANKNPDNPKKTTTLSYDVYKDKRFSEDQYELHIPIAINKCPKNIFKINTEVRVLLKHDDNPYVIGIARGERNLLYIVVVDGKGNIVEQYSLNEIINNFNGIRIKTDYHSLLDKKEKERFEARQNWTSIENIKELKAGYISQVVHKICELVEKYDAVIALEDLNSGFKNSRVKVEKQVYQKFEKMLIDKLNYMVDKKSNPCATGGALKGYQITNKFESFKSMSTQNGFIFYIPAWLTSKIDPSTGFVNLLKTKYTSIADSKKFISSFDRIMYVPEEDLFEFALDYKNFSRTDADYIKKWKLYSYGNRIRIFRNPKKNNVFDWEEVCLTSAYKELFNKYGINYQQGDIRALLCEQSDKAFYSSFMALMSLMLQMRNSITGRTDVDFLISPVKNSDGIFYDSRNYEAQENAILPKNADANGAYNIARKVLWAIGQFKKAEDEKLDKVKIAISNKEWLEYAQTSVKHSRADPKKKRKVYEEEIKHLKLGLEQRDHQIASLTVQQQRQQQQQQQVQQHLQQQQQQLAAASASVPVA
nr:DNase-dead CRISPR-associated endonuclease Cas12a [synthetic construct]